MRPYDTTRQCVVCGVVFPLTNPKRIYCSRTCLKRVSRSNQRASRTPQHCEYCGCLFQKRSDKAQRFCSKRCGSLHRFNSPEYIDQIPNRFWAQVHKGDGCWEWQGYCRRQGYGEFSVGGNYVLTHRYSWQIHNGVIPNGLDVCHTCDNPSCVRPDHLFLGTNLENTLDMVSKGRHIRGERSRSAKFTADDIRAIRASSLGIRELARQYGVAHSTIANIVHRRKWRHID